MFYFFYLSHFGGCEDDLYISTQQMDRWTDGRMDGWMNRQEIAPFYRTLSPIGAAAQKAVYGRTDHQKDGGTEGQKDVLRN